MNVWTMKIDAILEWSETSAGKDFDTTFVYKLQQQIETRGTLTEEQMESIDNVIEKYGIGADARKKRKR